MVNPNHSPQRNTPNSLIVALGGVGFLSACALLIPGCIQANHDRPQPTAVAATAFEMPGTDDPQKARFVQDQICKKAALLVERDNVPEDRAERFSLLEECDEAGARLIEDQEDGALDIIGNNVKVSIIESTSLMGGRTYELNAEIA